jgi:uncharacterized protein (DUF1684 family)
MDSATDRGWLADWRRRVAELYVEVRATAATDPAAAWAAWRDERETLYRSHPQSPLPEEAREGFRLPTWPYDDTLRWNLAVEDAPPPALGLSLAPLELPNSGSDTLAFDRVGAIAVPGPDGGGRLDLFWMRGYAGGLFLPFRDGTSGSDTYGAGRYLLDTAKGADLGGDAAAGTLVIDLNFAFHPSCAWDPKWACPLAPPSNRLAARVEAGERLR